MLDLETGEAVDWLRGASTRSEAYGRFSPDGRWIAYLSGESGRRELHLDRFPERGEKFRVSADGGSWPVWRRDGRDLFHASLTGDLMPARGFFDAAADGQRFLLNERIDPDEIAALVDLAARDLLSDM